MILNMKTLEMKAKELYGNGHISLHQAACYANTIEKRNFCMIALGTLLMHNRMTDRNNKSYLKEKIIAEFPILNHREQA